MRKKEKVDQEKIDEFGRKISEEIRSYIRERIEQKLYHKPGNDPSWIRQEDFGTYKEEPCPYEAECTKTGACRDWISQTPDPEKGPFCVNTVVWYCSRTAPGGPAWRE